ncbi:hypothetical protein Tco_0883899 [Tanacetum coccineum]
MESSNSNSKERELQLTQRLAKQRHSNCMTWFEQLETHLHDLYLLNSPYAVDAFKPAFRSFFGEEHQTFKLKMFHNLDQLRLQLERENLHGVNAKTCLQALRTQFKEFLASKGVNATDLLNQGWQQDFEDFTRCEPSAYRRELLENLDTLEAVIHRVVNTYGVLRMKENELNALKENGSQLHDEILHEHQIKSSVKMQSQDIQINPVQAMDDSLIVLKSRLIEPENNNAFSKSEIETQMQRQEEKVDMREVVDVGLIVTESNIGPVNDEEPFAEVQLTTLRNILANEQQHTEQSEPNYDTRLLETIDSNTTLTSTNMCHRGGEIARTRYASQVMRKMRFVKNSFIPHYLPKVRESAAAKPHQVNAPNYSRNSHKESYGSNDMVHAYFLEDARKMTQDKTGIPSHKDMASTRAHCTPNACTPKPRNIYRSSPVSKCSGGMLNG